MLKIRKIAKRDVIYPFYVENKSANGKRREKMDSNQEMFFEHLVIGSGLAGLSSALMLAEKCDGEIAVVTKGAVEDCNSRPSLQPGKRKEHRRGRSRTDSMAHGNRNSFHHARRTRRPERGA